MAPLHVVEWLRRTYPKPTIDPEWLNACLEWLSQELQLSDMNTQADEIISNVDSQLLNSDLHDSMLAGTGFPEGIGGTENAFLEGDVLVQIQGITDIGHSAFSLQTVQQTRQDRADMAGLAADDESDEGPIPEYPRGMLRFDLSDGSRSLRAIEYRRMPGLELGVTPLGFKMILRNVPIRRGIAFLEPSNVILKGYMTEELDANRDADFARGLRMRLGQPEPEPDDLTTPPLPADLDADPLPNANNLRRTPLREMTRDELARDSPRQSAREELEPPTRRRVPVASVSTSASRTVVSPYFTDPTSSATFLPSTDLASEQLSPVYRVPLPSGTLSRRTSAVEESLEFSDGLSIDDAFLQELDAAEQTAMENVQQRSKSNEQVHPNPQNTSNSEHYDVIVIDGGEDDKENLAPASQRRVRRRITTDDDSDVVVIE